MTEDADYKDQVNQISFDVVTEMKNAVQIIDHAAEQGAFRGWNAINQVLGCRSRIVAYIELFEAALAPKDDAPEGEPEIVKVAPVDGQILVADETPAPAPAPAPEAIPLDDDSDIKAALAAKRAKLLAELAELEAEGGK